MSPAQRRAMLDRASRHYAAAYPYTARAAAKHSLNQPHIVRDGWLAFWRAELLFHRATLK